MMGPRDIKSKVAEVPKEESPDDVDGEIDRLNQEWRKRRDEYRAADVTSGQSPEVADPHQATAASSCDSRLTVAAAVGDVGKCEQLLSEERIQPNSWDDDGLTPLCVAACHGHSEIVDLLLQAGADAGLPNHNYAGSTSLHAAAQHEQGKVCMALLAARADPWVLDKQGITPRDFASCSDAIWPLFAGAGCLKTAKEELVAKGVIRRAHPGMDSELMQGAGQGSNRILHQFSRPGSAYLRSTLHRPRPSAGVLPRLATGGRPMLAGSPLSARGSRPIDILAEGDAAPGGEPLSARGLRSLGI